MRQISSREARVVPQKRTNLEGEGEVSEVKATVITIDFIPQTIKYKVGSGKWETQRTGGTERGKDEAEQNPQRELHETREITAPEDQGTGGKVVRKWGPIEDG